MRPKPLQRVAEASLKVLVKRLLRARLVVIRNRFVENAPVAGLLQVCGHADDEPMWIVVESAANIVVAPLGERLKLMIGTTVGKLCRCQINDSLPCALRHHMHKAQQVLVGVAEAKPASDSR